MPTLTPYYLGGADRNGLLLGYGGLDLPQLRRAAGLLARALADAAGHR
ncbi:hypothetical protein ACFQDE_17805 [Deinococcus caeni]